MTQLIARRVRESGVYCEIHPYDKVDAMLDAFAPKAVILSGGPASAHEAESPAAPAGIFELGVPVLGVCYGEMTMCEQLGGAVESGHAREFGRALGSSSSWANSTESTIRIRSNRAWFSGVR